MSDQIKVTKRLRTIAAPDDKSKLSILDKLFRKVQIPTDDVLLPPDDLYVLHEDMEYGLRYIAARIFEWLNVTPKNLTIGFDEIEPAGLYVNQDNHHYIIVNSQYREDPFACAAILSHEIMHYILLGRFSIHIEDVNENEKLTDMATIESGLGVLIINGFYYDSGWASTLIGLMFGQLSINQTKLSFGYYKPKQYGKLLFENLKGLGVNHKDVGGYVIPQARAFVPRRLRKGREKPEFVMKNERSVRMANLKRVGIIVVLIPIAAIFWGVRAGSDTTTESPESIQKKSGYESCIAQANEYKAALDATESRMDSAELRGDSDGYNALVPLQNSQVATYNNQVDMCEQLRQEYNSQL